MNLRRIFFCIFILISSHELQAQPFPQIALQNLNPSLINPAFNGSIHNALQINFHTRMQWLKMENAPQTSYLQAHWHLPSIKSGLGIALGRDAIGLHQQWTAQVSASYIIPFKTFKIATGLRADFLQTQIRGNEIITPEGNYENSINHNDPMLIEQTQGGKTADFTTGISIYNNNLQAGISYSHALSSKTIIDKNTAFIYKNNATWNVFSTYNIHINNQLDIKPHVNIMTNTQVIQTIFGTNIYYKNNIWGGVAFRGYSKSTIEAICPTVGIAFADKYQLSYQYEWVMNGLRTYQRGSHEIYFSTLFHNILKWKKPKVIFNPRF